MADVTTDLTALIDYLDAGLDDGADRQYLVEEALRRLKLIQKVAAITDDLEQRPWTGPDVTASEPTRHTCNNGTGPHFGRKTSGCPPLRRTTGGRRAPHLGQFLDRRRPRRSHS